MCRTPPSSAFEYNYNITIVRLFCSKPFAVFTKRFYSLIDFGQLCVSNLISLNPRRVNVVRINNNADKHEAVVFQNAFRTQSTITREYVFYKIMVDNMKQLQVTMK